MLWHQRPKCFSELFDCPGGMNAPATDKGEIDLRIMRREEFIPHSHLAGINS